MQCSLEVEYKKFLDQMLWSFVVRNTQYYHFLDVVAPNQHTAFLYPWTT